MDEYRGYLRNALVVEKTVVSYRLLSRALKVHVNQAKEMLYDFYTSENARKSKSVHATYIVTGYRKPPPSAKAEEVGSSDDDDDAMMFDSSLPGTQATVTAEEGEKTGLVRVVELCQEEELDVAKAEFEKVLSVHLYSIEQMPLEDFSILTGCCVQLLLIHQKEDPLKMGATYGTITNPNATRTGSRAPPPPEQRQATMSVGKEMRKEVVSVKKETAAKETKSEKKDEPEVKAEAKGKKPATKASAKKTAPPAAAKLKRGQSNDFFNSWKTAPKKMTAGSASEPSSAAPSPKVEEEPIMEMGSDDDDDDEDNDEPFPSAHDNADNARKRKEKEEELKNMMDEEEEEEEEEEGEGEEDEEDGGGEGDIDMQDDEPPVVVKIGDSPEPEQPSGTVAGVKTGDGRVRGRRKVSKKAQSRDEEGYLVTKTEYIWESFSEDEPEPPKPKPALKPAAKGKKSKDDQSKLQGNLMSYFAKK